MVSIYTLVLGSTNVKDEFLLRTPWWSLRVSLGDKEAEHVGFGLPNPIFSQNSAFICFSCQILLEKKILLAYSKCLKHISNYSINM